MLDHHPLQNPITNIPTLGDNFELEFQKYIISRPNIPGEIRAR